MTDELTISPKQRVRFVASLRQRLLHSFASLHRSSPAFDHALCTDQRVVLPGNISDVKCDIPELKGDNYKVWKERVLLQLGCMDIDYAIRKDEPLGITETSTPDAVVLYEKWERSNRLSVMFIKTKISASIRGSVDKHTKVKDLLKAIDEQFASSDKALASTLIMQFSSIRLIGIKGVRDHIMRMRDIAAQLKDLEVTISDTFLVHYILCTLPHQYGPFKVSYNTHKDKWSINELMTMCVQEEGRLVMEEGEKVNLTTSAKKKKDHTKDKEKGQIPPNQAIKKESSCFSCKKKGHMKKDCVKFKAWLKKKEVRVYNPHEKKLDPRTISGYFKGYPEKSKGYRFYCPSHSTRIVESRNAKFLENDLVSGSDQIQDIVSEQDHDKVSPPDLSDILSDRLVVVHAPQDKLGVRQPVTEIPQNVDDNLIDHNENEEHLDDQQIDQVPLRRSVRMRKSAISDDYEPRWETRLLADIPPTTDRERELRSKFLNDPSTPEEQNLTLRYLTASQSGNKQTLRELRHQILARRTRRHPPADAVPGLDVLPLREHAWLDSLADAGVRVSSDFYDRLQECATPNPPIIDLGDNSDSPTTMDQEDNTEVVYQRRTGLAASKALMVEEDSRSGREEDHEVGPGTSALWLPEDAYNGPLIVVIDEPWRRDALEMHYPRVARDLYHMPAPYKLIVPSEGSTITECPPSLDHLDLDVLGVDNDYRLLTNLPAPPPSDYLTMHSSTNGRRGGNRHGPQTIRRRGRGPSVSTRVPIVATTSAANSPTVPLRPSATRTVTRGGSVSRRRSREQTVEDSTANKRQAVEDPGASAANEVLVEDLDPSAEEVQAEGANAAGIGTAGGGSLVSQTTSSIKEKLRELIATPSFLSNLSPGIFYRFREWIEKKEVPLSDAVAAAFAPQTVTLGKIYQPNWDVKEDESLYSDIPENGGILAYRILKEQYLEYQRLADTYKASLETCQGLLKEAEEKLAPLEDEVITVRDRAALLEEAEENVKALTKAVETANNEKEIAVLDVSATEVRGAANAVANFKASEEYVAELHKRYDGGWAAAMRCVCKTVPGFDWNVIEDAHAAGQHLSPFEGDPNFAEEDAIADVDPREPTTPRPPPS
ncbi:hypothetical protein BVRB_9g209660 [Beta vulgaris subsp. vulgaris]|nr:hypothetical protein BVRB_9g209660 [Beta vulgaris subsp. vulgaris]